MDSFALKPPGHVLLDTDGMPAQDGLMRWRELLFDTIPLVQDIQPIGAQKKTPDLFKVKSSLQFVGECALLSGTLSHDFTLRYVRGQAEISRTHVDGMFVHLHASGMGTELGTGRQRPFNAEPSDWVLLSTADTYQGTFRAGRSSAAVLSLPAQFCTDMRIDSDKLGRRMSFDQPLNRLVANYIQTLAAGGTISDAVTGDAVARNLVELIALATNSSRENQEVCCNGLASGLMLVLMQYLDAHFAQPDLSPAHVAAHAGITPRHVHRLFERTGTTFGEQLFQRRLRHAHRMLSDAAHRHRSITDIAFDCGFSNVSHFGRRYHAMYKQTPSETRGIRMA